MTLKAVAQHIEAKNLYCLTCHMDMCSVIEAAEHLLGNCVVESVPNE